MGYRNKTYVAFASEDLHQYRLMTAWRGNQKIDFDFFDAHDLNTALDSSSPETIKRRLGERLANAKQAVLLGSPVARRKGNDGRSFLAYEVQAIARLGLPVVVANLAGDRGVVRRNIPDALLGDYYTMSTSFQPRIIKYALDQYVPNFATGRYSGQYYYESHIYLSLQLAR